MAIIPKIQTAALLLSGFALISSPSYGQDGGRRHEGQGSRREGEQRAVPRGQEAPRSNPAPRAEQPRAEQPRAEQPNRGEGRPNSAQAERRGEGRPNNEAYRRDEGRPNNAAPARRYDGRPYYRDARPRVVTPYRSYGYRPYDRRSYVVPYGYRPYGYRPGWNLNLYFGRPAYGYPLYGESTYGYYSLAPGGAYGSLRIVDAPSESQVFVDGYYAGTVDDYDGVFQHLNLEAGVHHIEIDDPYGSAPIAFDIRIEPGRALTYRAYAR
jgi:hypothetical protein